MTKISNLLIRKYGLSKNLEPQSIQSYLRQIVVLGLKKLQKCRRKGHSSLKNFAITDKLVSVIVTPEYLNLQYALVQLYLSKMQNREIISSLCQQMNSLLQKHAARSISRDEEFEESFDSAESYESARDEQNLYQESPEREPHRIMEEPSFQERELNQQRQKPAIDFSTFQVEQDEDVLYFSD